MPTTDATQTAPSPTLVVARSIELLVLYVAGPIGFTFLAEPTGWLFPAIWIWCLLCIALLLPDKRFERKRLFNLRGVRPVITLVLWRFGALVGPIALVVWLFAPERFLELPQANPRLWLMIMALYPLFSVYPQEVIFRTFFFQRYAPLFRTPWTMIIASGLLFAFAHILFRNWIAVAMCIPGGIFFAHTYHKSNSTLAAWIDHTLFGCLVFTIGLGSYFFTGAIGR